MNEATVSMVLPVHAGIGVTEWEACLSSIVQQTRAPDELVIVEDGPVSQTLREVSRGVLRDGPSTVRVTLPTNGGAGIANQAGLLAASGTWIAKADADDISLPERLTIQLTELRDAGADVCSAAMVEFSAETGHAVGLRANPSTHAAIARKMKMNNPVNHPTAVFNRGMAVECGGYPSMRYMQDYVLFARLLASGARFTAVTEPLVRFRAGEGMSRRRRSPEMASLEWELQAHLHGLGIVSRPRMFANYAVRMAYRRSPIRMMSWLQHHALSRTVSEAEAAG